MHNAVSVIRESHLTGRTDNFSEKQHSHIQQVKTYLSFRIATISNNTINILLPLLKQQKGQNKGN